MLSCICTYLISYCHLYLVSNSFYIGVYCFISIISGMKCHIFVKFLSLNAIYVMALIATLACCLIVYVSIGCAVVIRTVVTLNFFIVWTFKLWKIGGQIEWCLRDSFLCSSFVVHLIRYSWHLSFLCFSWVLCSKVVSCFDLTLVAVYYIYCIVFLLIIQLFHFFKKWN